MSDSRLMIPPPCEPISLADAKLQLRVNSDQTFDDDLIRACISAARSHVETITRRQIVLATYRVTLDAFPGSMGGRSDWGYLGGGVAGAAMAPKAWPNTRLDDAAIQLYGGPLQSVLSLKYVDPSGTTQTMAAADYAVDLSNDPARIMPVNGNSFNGWPQTISGQLATVEVNAAAGWMTPCTISTAGILSLPIGAAPLENGQAVQFVASDLSDVSGLFPTALKQRLNYYVVNFSTSSMTCQLALSAGGTPITVTSGTGTILVDGCPEPVRQSVRILLTHFYENRGDKDASIPQAIEALLTPWKVWRF